MAIKETNHEVKITLSEEQFQWLEKASKNLHLSKSKFISWLMSKKAKELYELVKMKNNKMDDEELQKIIDICHTPWLDN